MKHKSKLPDRPKLETEESGRRRYQGALSSAGGGKSTGKTQTPPRPKVVEAPDGSRYCEGSISAQAGLLIDPRQEREICQQLREPKHISEVTVSGKSPFDPFHAESIRRYVAKLSEAGYAELQRDGKKSSGWQLTPSGVEFLAGLTKPVDPDANDPSVYDNLHKQPE